MEASKVYYTDFRCPVGTSLTEKLRRLCLAAGIKNIDMDGRFVAIKMHFGELGNLAYLRPNYAKVVADLRAAYGERPVRFTTDCICGFPGETPEDFAESCDFLKKIGFLKVHVFPYSRRSGTPAYDFPDQIHEREKQDRSRKMNALAEDIRGDVLKGYEGMEDEVLLETPLSETLFTGYTRLYVPVVVSAPGHKSGEIVRVRLGAYDGERVRAALC